MGKSTPAAAAAEESAPAAVAAEAPPAPAVPAVPAEPVLGLDEACALMSARGGPARPVGKALLAAFNFTEEAAGRVSGTEAEFRARLAEFAGSVPSSPDGSA